MDEALYQSGIVRNYTVAPDLGEVAGTRSLEWPRVWSQGPCLEDKTLLHLVPQWILYEPCALVLEVERGFPLHWWPQPLGGQEVLVSPSRDKAG